MERGWAVRGAVRRAEAVVPAGAHKGVVGPLDGATDWQAALDGVDAVVHCAARGHVRRETKADPMAAFRRIHVVATRHLSKQARTPGVPRFVFLRTVGAAVAEVRTEVRRVEKGWSSTGIAKWRRLHSKK